MSDARADARAWLRTFEAACRRRDFEEGRRLFAPDAVAFGTYATAVHGLDNIAPVSLPSTGLVPAATLTPRQNRTALARRTLTARGLSEKDYMSGNLLGLEVTAEHVAQAFLHHALADRTTGDVTTVDGGNIAAVLR